MDDETAGLLARHNLALPVEHDNLQPAECVCARARVVMERPSSGNACHVCGGITVQTGTCTTCTECGATGGCG